MFSNKNKISSAHNTEGNEIQNGIHHCKYPYYKAYYTKNLTSPLKPQQLNFAIWHVLRYKCISLNQKKAVKIFVSFVIAYNLHKSLGRKV